MARSISDIQQAIILNLVTASAAAGVTVDPANWSAYDYRQLLTYVVAASIGIFEQLMDAAYALIYSLSFGNSPQVGGWLQNQMFLFQYDATTPQVAQVIPPKFTPTYAVVDASKQVIKYCTVTKGIYGTCLIKVACQQDGAPIDTGSIDAGILPAAQSYVDDTLAAPGITYNVVSTPPDRLYLQLDVWYKGQYSAVIQDSVIAAIKAYLGGIPFDGKIVLSDMEAALKAVTGVNDVAQVNVQARANATTVLMGTNLVLNNTELQRNFQTIAGYIIPEDTAGYTLTDFRSGSSGPLNLNLIAE